ncbi:MAG: CsgG/HfaB family protein [Chitinophagaceae bacterium]
MHLKPYLIAINILLPVLINAQDIFNDVPAVDISQGAKLMAAKMSHTLSQKEKKVITINSFLDAQKCVTELGNIFANEIETQLLKRSESVTVVSRQELDKVIRELKISRDRISENENIKKIGELLNVDAIVIGTYYIIKEEVKFNVHYIDARTGQKIGADEQILKVDQDVQRLIANYVSCEDSMKVTKYIEFPSFNKFKKETSDWVIEFKSAFDVLEKGWLTRSQSIECNFIVTKKNDTRFNSNNLYYSLGDAQSNMVLDKSTILTDKFELFPCSNIIFPSSLHTFNFDYTIGEPTAMKLVFNIINKSYTIEKIIKLELMIGNDKFIFENLAIQPINKKSFNNSISSYNTW